MQSCSPSILVTGGAGYIGSHTVLSLREKGYRIVILDNFLYGHRDLVETMADVELVVGDINDYPLLTHVFETRHIVAVLHFAAYAYVSESIHSPRKYYRNNVVGSLTLFEAMLDSGVDKIVFSSTCATYGIPEKNPIDEKQAQKPINPYGASKLAVERMLQDFSSAYDLKSVTFRYFNAAGADPKGRLGEDHDPEPHLIPLVLYTALKRRDCIHIFGIDYDTPDGSAVRDYIHVSDLADAHVLGLEYLLNGGETTAFNLGNGQGFSVKEVINTARLVTKLPIPSSESDRRLGDPPILVASYEKAKRILGWQPKYPNLSQMLTHAWRWHQERHAPSNSMMLDAIAAQKEKVKI